MSADLAHNMSPEMGRFSVACLKYCEVSEASIFGPFFRSIGPAIVFALGQNF